MNFKEEYLKWLSSEVVDEETKAELRAIETDEEEINERFYKNLEFGTGGLRGIMGAGINRMNIYTVRKATQGLADFIAGLGNEAKEKGVVISYDSRNNSKEFAKEAAACLAANGIKAYLSDRLRPVPQLSYGVRYFGATCGIMVTASHNPPKYNGYKVYGDDGGQMPPEAADKVLEIIERTDIFADVKTCDFEEALADGRIVMFGELFDNSYLREVMAQRINPEAVDVLGSDFKMIYTPLHGSGNIPVRRILDMAGFKNVLLVEEQLEPNGDFPTVKSPNPEERDAFNLAIELAKKEDIDFIIGTDPDCDRIGVVVRDKDGEYIPLTGNMVGALLTDYILSSKKISGTLPDNGVVIKTIVTSYMADAICESYGVDVINVLTGFKFIGEKIREFEENNNYKTYLLGFEESYGYLVGTYARDKDAVVSAMLISEMAAWYKIKGKSLYDGLCDLYEKYGTFRESLTSITIEGAAGVEKIKEIMSTLRQNPPKTLAEKRVRYFSDYQSSIKADVNTGKTYEIILPKSNVLLFELEGGCWWAARPSGTEPKIKFYFGAKGNSIEEAEALLVQMKEEISGIVNNI